ncbi:unnamed protein product [Hymenolepis diminuta]|uniref:Uncharacterized protein n=1 Tax=Hymenolepis diminuta TaxID=6216 RepID=A0A564ZAS0_HYMDI|nr:unnamed protein product [Hymenolepis diminuta]
MPIISTIRPDAEAEILRHKPHCLHSLNHPAQTKTCKKRMTSCKINTFNCIQYCRPASARFLVHTALTDPTPHTLDMRIPFSSLQFATTRVIIISAMPLPTEMELTVCIGVDDNRPSKDFKYFSICELSFPGLKQNLSSMSCAY